jgi:hypothetical protein
MTTPPIDFVIPWVDGNDPVWLEELNRYRPKDSMSARKRDYREWDNLQYLFRGFETFTPWVNKIYFVTHGHLPPWLDTDHPKLVIIKHSDFLDPKDLPVFNSHAIEINLHRIPGLSEHFVYFNDDTFILKPLTVETFFKHGLPVNAAIANTMHEGEIAHIVLNDIDLINKNFNRHKGKGFKKNQIIRRYLYKWFYPGYGFKILNTLLLMHWPTFTGFLGYHHPQPFLQQTFAEVWEKEYERLKETSGSKFRDNRDVNQYLFRYWQFATGKFWPDSYRRAYLERKYIEIRVKEDALKAADDIKSKKYEMYCANDATSKGRFTQEDMSEEDFELCKQAIREALEILLPHPSQFER